MKLKPLHDKIVIKPIETKGDEITDAGIILPDSSVQGKLLEGEVIAAGHAIYSSTGDSIPIVVEVGDKILYSKHAQVYEYGEYVIMSQIEVLSILENN